MKKILFAILFGSSSLAMSAQVLSNDASPTVKEAFKAKFGSDAASYTSYQNGEIIALHPGSTDTWSVFDKEGQFIQTETLMDKANLPNATATDMQTRFAGPDTELEYRSVVLANQQQQYSIIYTKGSSTVQVYYQNDKMLRRAIR